MKKLPLHFNHYGITLSQAVNSIQSLNFGDFTPDEYIEVDESDLDIRADLGGVYLCWEDTEENTGFFPVVYS